MFLSPCRKTFLSACIDIAVSLTLAKYSMCSMETQGSETFLINTNDQNVYWCSR